MTKVIQYEILLVTGVKMTMVLEEGYEGKNPITIYNEAVNSTANLNRFVFIMSDHKGPNLIINLGQVAAISRLEEIP